MAIFGRSPRFEQVQRYTPQQQAALDQLLQQALAALQQPAFDFGPIEQRARTQFAQQTVPSIAERFTAMGAGQRSSAFPAVLGRAGAGLEEGLASLRAQTGLQQRGLEQQKLLSLLGMGLQPRFESVFSPRQPGFLESAAQPLLYGLGTLLGGGLGSVGGGLSSLLSLFGGR